MYDARNPAHRADDFRMALMADQDDLEALFGIALAFLVHLGDQRTGRVEHRQGAVGRGILDRLGDAVGAEDGDRAVGDLVQLLDEPGALGGEFLHDPLVVDDLVAHIDRRPVALERLLDDLDRALDAGAEAARLGEDDLHRELLKAIEQVAPETRTVNRRGGRPGGRPGGQRGGRRGGRHSRRRLRAGAMS